MEHAERVNNELGENNLKLLYHELDEGKITKLTIKSIALEMKWGVHGVFKKNKDLDFVDLFKLLLDRWYSDHLHREDVDGYDELVRILSIPSHGLGYLAADMQRETQHQSIPLDQVMYTRNGGEIEMACSLKGPQNEDYEPDAANKLLHQKQRCESKLESGIEEIRPPKYCNKWVLGCIILGVVGGLAVGNSIYLHLYEDSPVENVEDKGVTQFVTNGTLPFWQSDISHTNVDTPMQQTNNFTSTSNNTNHKEQISKSFKVKNGKFIEFHSCKVPQNNVPDLPGELVDVVGIFTEKLGLLVCGGLDVGDDPTPDHPRMCYTYELGRDRWDEFEHRLNTNRRGSNMKLSGNKIYIIGGHSSDPILDCYPSLEVLDLHNLSEGWKEEESIGECFTDQVIEVPCI